jgi:hypothetical protein
MITYRFNEIENKHGQYIAYWSKQPGNTELEKYKNFIQSMYHKDIKSIYTEHILQDNNGNDITCYVDNEEGDEGYILVCFNNLGETILNTHCYGNEQVDILEVLDSDGIL